MIHTLQGENKDFPSQGYEPQAICSDTGDKQLKALMESMEVEVAGSLQGCAEQYAHSSLAGLLFF